jgi:hypothetical protein
VRQPGEKGDLYDWISSERLMTTVAAVSVAFGQKAQVEIVSYSKRNTQYHGAFIYYVTRSNDEVHKLHSHLEDEGVPSAIPFFSASLDPLSPIPIISITLGRTQTVAQTDLVSMPSNAFDGACSASGFTISAVGDSSILLSVTGKPPPGLCG